MNQYIIFWSTIWQSFVTFARITITSTTLRFHTVVRINSLEKETPKWAAEVNKAFDKTVSIQTLKATNKLILAHKSLFTVLF